MKSKPNLILLGTGGHARSCIDVIEHQNYFNIAGLIGLPNQLHQRIFGYVIIGLDEDLPCLAKDYEHAFVVLGQICNAASRIMLFDKAKKNGFKIPSIISPASYVSPHASIGEGTIIMNGAIINAGVKIGKNCIINSRALIEHDSIVEDHCHISTGAILNGQVTIGSKSFVGSNCVIKQGISIGRECVIGMGLAVRSDITKNTTYIGNLLNE